jgi:glycosyltransferase involved in cell wall biosynthesis
VNTGAGSSANAVTVSVACFGVNRYIRRAVEGLLAQTHRALTVVVVSDADPDPPWNALAGISDPRLVRFALAENHGPYFAHQVVLGASATPYFSVHDADDWSAPPRIATLLRALIADGSDLAFSAWQQYREGDDGVARKESIRWRRRMPGDAAEELFLFDPRLTDEFVNRAAHHGVFRREALENIGGCYGGFRMNYDTLLTNLILMTGRISFVEEPLYYYTLRPDSLSHSAATGVRSQARMMAKARLAALYGEALGDYRAWHGGEMASAEFLERVRGLCGRFVSAEDRAALGKETARLAAVLSKKR